MFIAMKEERSLNPFQLRQHQVITAIANTYLLNTQIHCEQGCMCQIDNAVLIGDPQLCDGHAKGKVLATLVALSCFPPPHHSSSQYHFICLFSASLMCYKSSMYHIRSFVVMLFMVFYLHIHFQPQQQHLH
jgi:hypothetical protein